MKKLGWGFRNEWVAHFYVSYTTDRVCMKCEGKCNILLYLCGDCVHI